VRRPDEEEDVTARLFRAPLLLAACLALGACAGARVSGASFAVKVAEKPAKWERVSRADHVLIVRRNCKIEIADTASKRIAASFDGKTSIRTLGTGTLKIWLMRVYKQIDEKTGKLERIRVFTKDSIDKPDFSLDAGARYDIDCVDRYTTLDPLSQLQGWHVTVTERTAASGSRVVFDSRSSSGKPPARVSRDRH